MKNPDLARRLKLQLYDNVQDIVRLGLTTEGLAETIKTLTDLTNATTGRKLGLQLVFLEQHDISAQLNPLIDEVFRLGVEYQKLTSHTEKQEEFDKLVSEMEGVRKKISQLLMQ